MPSDQTIGSRIRAFRTARGLSPAELAQASGLTEEFLLGLENDGIYPAIGPLHKIARALELRLGTFLDDQVGKDPIITRSDRHPGGDPALHRGAMPAPSYSYHALGKGKSDRNMEPLLITIRPLPDDRERKPSSHQGEEFIYVLEGTLVVEYGRERHELHPGDTIYYNSIVPHHVAAGDGKPARILAVTYNP
ncbi:cupin domain-containing protein [uncultured Desulfovibrio sp.]|uniref:cupin domain-containing protein n=1 Tax=uncultured Desulfovibrio sp. TaxID=167968 RepID=UPI00262BA6E4|nr:cupin domain-containing protein [uncultured Desulfovibrio sp.]